MPISNLENILWKSYSNYEHNKLSKANKNYNQETFDNLPSPYIDYKHEKLIEIMNGTNNLEEFKKYTKLKLEILADLFFGEIFVKNKNDHQSIHYYNYDFDLNIFKLLKLSHKIIPFIYEKIGLNVNFKLNFIIPKNKTIKVEIENIDYDLIRLENVNIIINYIQNYFPWKNNFRLAKLFASKIKLDLGTDKYGNGIPFYYKIQNNKLYGFYWNSIKNNIDTIIQNSNNEDIIIINNNIDIYDIIRYGKLINYERYFSSNNFHVPNDFFETRFTEIIKDEIKNKILSNLDFDTTINIDHIYIKKKILITYDNISAELYYYLVDVTSELLETNVTIPIFIVDEVKTLTIDNITNYDNIYDDYILPKNYISIVDYFKIKIDKKELKFKKYGYSFMIDVINKMKKLENNELEKIVYRNSVYISINENEYRVKLDEFNFLKLDDLPWFKNKELARLFLQKFVDKKNFDRYYDENNYFTIVYDYDNTDNGMNYKYLYDFYGFIYEGNTNKFETNLLLNIDNNILDEIYMIKYGKLMNYHKYLYVNKNNQNITDFKNYTNNNDLFIYNSKKKQKTILVILSAFYYGYTIYPIQFNICEMGSNLYIPIITYYYDEINTFSNIPLHKIDKVKNLTFKEFVNIYEDDSIFIDDSFNLKKELNLSKIEKKDNDINVNISSIFNNDFLYKILKKWNTLNYKEKNLHLFYSGNIPYENNIHVRMRNNLEDNLYVPDDKIHFKIPSIENSKNIIYQINKNLKMYNSYLFDKIKFVYLYCNFFVYDYFENRINEYYLYITKSDNNNLIPFINYKIYNPLTYDSSIPDIKNWYSYSRNDNGGFNYIIDNDITLNVNSPIVLSKGDVFDGRNHIITVKNVKKWIGLFMINTFDIDSKTNEKFYPIIKNLNINFISSTLENDCGIFVTSSFVFKDLTFKRDELFNLNNKFSKIFNKYHKDNIKNNIYNLSESNYFKILNCNSFFSNLSHSCGGICGSKIGENGKCIIVNCKSIGTYVSNNAGAICGPYCGSKGICEIISSSYDGNIIGSNSGGICGSYCASDGICDITNCEFKGNITGDYLGGICGSFAASGSDSYLTISYCNSGNSNNILNMTGVKCGGICGSDCAQEGTIKINNCYLFGNIDNHCGGICGGNSCSNGNLDIFGCYSNGDIGISGGGIVGKSTSINGNLVITSCYSLGNISSFAGGITGDNTGGNSNIKIEFCYTNADKIGENGGGICGANTKGNVSVYNCYNTTKNLLKSSGGIAGLGSVIDVKNCYSNIGDSNSVNGDIFINEINFMNKSNSNNLLLKLNYKDYFLKPYDCVHNPNINNLNHFENITIDNNINLKWSNIEDYLLFDWKKTENNETFNKIKKYFKGDFFPLSNDEIIQEKINLSVFKNIDKYTKNNKTAYIIEFFENEINLYSLKYKNDYSCKLNKFTNNFIKQPTYPILKSFTLLPWKCYSKYKSSPSLPRSQEIVESFYNGKDNKHKYIKYILFFLIVCFLFYIIKL